MPSKKPVILGVNHFAPWLEEEKRVSFAEVEKAVEQLRIRLKQGGLIGFGTPQFRIELFKLYKKAVDGTLPEKFRLPPGLQREEARRERELIQAMAVGAKRHGKERVEKVLAANRPVVMYFFELYLRAKSLGYGVVGLVPAKVDRAIENAKERVKEQEKIDLMEIAHKEEEMAKYISTMRRIPDIIIDGAEHISRNGLDYRLSLKGIQCRAVTIGKKLSQERITRNSRARLRFQELQIRRILREGQKKLGMEKRKWKESPIEANNTLTLIRQTPF